MRTKFPYSSLPLPLLSLWNYVMHLAMCNTELFRTKLNKRTNTGKARLLAVTETFASSQPCVNVAMTVVLTAPFRSRLGHASQAPQTQNPVAYREAKTRLHFRYNGDWKKENGGYQAHLDSIWRLERTQQTIIFRLRTGHCGLSAHLKRTGISDTSLCECGQAD